MNMTETEICELRNILSQLKKMYETGVSVVVNENSFGGCGSTCSGSCTGTCADGCGQNCGQACASICDGYS